MRVIKRNGSYQNVQFDKITKRINHLAYNLKVDPVLVAQKVCGQLIDGIQTSMLDEISAQICMAMYSIHPDYNTLGSRILIDNHIKNTPTSLLDVVSNLGHILNPDYIKLIEDFSDKYDDMIDYERDFLIDYFGMKTLMKSYLLKKDNVIIERPQHLWMRVAIFLHKEDFNAVKETYDWLSTKHFTHASPTLYNSGTKSPQLSSCFVKGTLVDTVNRGPIPIENVVQGDTVLTHLKNIKPVVQCHINKLNSRKLYKVNLYNTRPFTVTHDHKLWVYNSNTQKLKWTRVEDLLATDFVSIPSVSTQNKEKFESTKFSIKPYITKYIYTDKRIIDYDSWKEFEKMSHDSYFLTEFDLNEELMWLLGVFIRYCKVNYNLENLNTINGTSIFTLDDKIPQLIEKYFNLKVEKTETFYIINNVYLGIFCESLLNRLPIEFYSLSDSLVSNFLQGFCLNTTTDNIDIKICNTNLVQDIYTLFRLHNICANYDDSHFIIDRYYHGLEGVSSKLNPEFRNIEGTTFVRFNSKELIPSDNIDVYTLGIEDDHSYSISGIIAKNCFLTTVEDSIEGIFKTLTDCAQISKWAGGIGVNISDIRGKNSVIRGTNGVTQGIVPLLKTYNATCRYVNQCFVGSTIVYTNNGPKAIKNINPEVDFVLTSDGTYKQVFEKFENPIDKKILKIKNVYTLESIKCTNEHELYVSKDDGQTFNYISAKELCINDLMAFPIPIEIQDNDSIDYELCRLYGIILARGYYKDNWYYLVIPKKYQDTIEFIEKFYPSYNESDTSIVFRFKLLNTLRHEWVYPYEKTKAIHPTFLNLPNDKLNYVLKGLFETKYTYNNRYFYFINSNRMLIESIRYAFLKLKTLTFGNKLVKSNAYYIKIPIHEALDDLVNVLGIDCIYEKDHILWMEKNGHLLSRIKSIDSINYKGQVYDLQIDHNHNYTTHMGLVHNSGKRLGSFAMYIEPWHSDVLDFLNAKKNQGAEEERARDLFYALWIPDLFMERVEKDEMWSLMCPDTCKGLTSVYGDEFKNLYVQYENEGKYVRQLKARQVWDAIIESQIETGVPYMLYKDAVNKKSPQENIGVIKQSNLCTEIVLYTDKDHISVCNLASIALPSFINLETMEFDFEKLEKVTRVITRNLNKVIDLNYYPVKEAKSTNLKHRPIGIGVQGMADVFAIMKWPFDSEKSRYLNKCIFECIYYAAISESCKLSEKYGPYALFEGSPMSKGILQFDMWNKEYKHPSDRYDWNKLKQDIIKFGLRNSTVLAPMPTASTSQILGFNECIVEGTMVTDVHGISQPIEKIEPDDNILSLNENINKLVTDKVVEKMDKDVKPVLKIQLIDGRYIECTSEHKFRVYNIKTLNYEWKEANELNRDYSLVMGIKGIQNVHPQFDVKYFENYLNNPTKEQCCALARLLGFVLADGNYIDCERTIVRLETLYDLQLIVHDLELLDDTKTYIITDNNINITLEIGKPITNILCKILTNCKEPDKNVDHILSTESNNDVLIPELLLDENCPKMIIREFLAGYLGGDGFSPFLKMTKDNKSKMVGCNIVRAVGHYDYNKMAKFMQNIKILFNRIGIITSIKTKEYIHNNSHIVIFNVKMLNISEFVNTVGFRYNIHKILRNDIYQLVLNYKDKIVEQRNYIVAKVFELYNTNKCVDTIYNSAIQMYDDIFLNEQSIPTLSHVKMCLEQKSLIDTYIDIDKEQLFKDIGVQEWFVRNNTIVEKTKLCLPVYHVPFLNSFENGNKRVYDINTLETHTFLANGIVVHNCIEPFTSNLYLRRTLAGEFTCINKYLIQDLHELGLWSKELMEKLIYYKGSVQYIKEIPQHLKDVYKTVWEIKQRSLIEMAADRGVYICQSQSLNLFFENPNYSKLTSAHFLGWKLGLKTGSYYVRSQSAIDAQNFTIDPEKEKQLEQEKLEQQVVICPMRPKGSSNYEPCEACSG